MNNLKLMKIHKSIHKTSKNDQKLHQTSDMSKPRHKGRALVSLQSHGVIIADNTEAVFLVVCTIYEESVVDKFKSNLLLMIIWLNIINYNS